MENVWVVLATKMLRCGGEDTPESDARIAGASGMIPRGLIHVVLHVKKTSRGFCGGKFTIHGYKGSITPGPPL